MSTPPYRNSRVDFSEPVCSTCCYSPHIWFCLFVYLMLFFFMKRICIARGMAVLEPTGTYLKFAVLSAIVVLAGLLTGEPQASLQLFHKSCPSKQGWYDLLSILLEV